MPKAEVGAATADLGGQDRLKLVLGAAGPVGGADLLDALGLFVVRLHRHAANFWADQRLDPEHVAVDVERCSSLTDGSFEAERAEDLHGADVEAASTRVDRGA